MKSGAIAALAAGAVLLLGGGAFAQTLEAVRAGESLRIAIADEAPYGYVGAEGEITGEAPEIARRVLERIDPSIQSEFVVTDFGDLISGLNGGRFDLAAAGMYITPERCGQVAFSDPTYVVGEAFAVQAGNPKGLSDFTDVARNDDAVLAVMAGAIEYNYAFHAGVPADRVRLYPGPEAAIEALRAGEVDAVALTALTVRAALDGLAGSELEATEQFYPVQDGEEVRGYGAFAFRKGDERLRDVFNEHLSAFVGTEEHLALVESFGFSEDMIPDVTAEELCNP